LQLHCREDLDSKDGENEEQQNHECAYIRKRRKGYDDCVEDHTQELGFSDQPKDTADPEGSSHSGLLGAEI